ncbi:MAG TPA: SemiSWEET family transporter [Micromonosporaceae bacterium]
MTAVATVDVLAICAGAWGLLMALSPVLQIRQMWLTQSSKDVSLGYFGVMLPGFILWIAYGSVRQDWALVIPNAVAFMVALATVAVASHLRHRLRDASSADR